VPSIDLLLVILCAALWLVHALQLRRVPLRRTWPALAIVALALACTAATYALAPDRAALVAVALVSLLLVAPVMATRAAGRALRFGRGSRARVLATLACVLRPLAAQRHFLRSLGTITRLARGEAVDVDAEVERLGVATALERNVQTLAFLSWTNDFARMAPLARDAAVQNVAHVSGLGAVVTLVLGETASEIELCHLYDRLVGSRALSRRSDDTAWLLAALAAYLGEAEVVESMAVELAGELPPERLAFLVATAQQRAGRPDDAELTLSRALAAPMTAAARARLEHRRENALAPAVVDDAVARVGGEVKRRLEARRVLAGLGLGWRRPVPLTWATAVVLAACFVVQHRVLGARAAIDAWALIAPFSDAPEPVRLVSYAFLHVDPTHLSVNLLGLLLFGRFVERAYGVIGFLATCLAGAAAGGAMFLFFERGSGAVVGASGSVLALFGATVSRIALDPPLRRDPQGRRELVLLSIVAGSQLVVDALWAESSGSAHAGGLVAGLVVGAVLLPRGPSSVR
jgi:membrane associated rhomboid family serine protease